jgi:hypothetical protein
MGTTMTKVQAPPDRPAVATSVRPAAGALRLDRKCAECSEEEEQHIEIQRKAELGAAPPNGHSFGGLSVLAPAAPAAAVAVSEPSDPAEQEADRVAERVMGMLSHGAPPSDGGLALSASGPAVQRAPDEQAPAQPQAAASGGFLVDDDAAATMPGQMRKSEFLSALRPAVCTAADRELARVGRNSDGCPYLDRWFGYYQGQDAQHVERSLRKYAPETASATSARDYIAPISARVAQGVHRWADTGKVPELPEGITPDMLTGGGVMGALASVGSAITSGLSAVGNFFGGLFRKAAGGGDAPRVDGGALSAQLGAGQPLDATSRSRMGSAFGYDFGAVRVHADASAAAAAQSLNARAFTLGTHVAFGAGQYRPGDLVGDALIAHELAHVVQQGGARPDAPLQAPAEPDAVEQDADASAVAAMLTLWKPEGAGHGERHGERKDAKPLMRSGLQLRRCGGPQTPLPEGIGTSHSTPAPTPAPTFPNVSQEGTPRAVDQMIAASSFLKPYVDQKKLQGVRAVGHMHIETEEDFKRHWAHFLRQSINDDTGKLYTWDEAQAAANKATIDGFTDGTETYVRGPIATVATALHEQIHAYSQANAFYEAAGHGADEGATEYFTDVVLADNSQKNDSSAYTHRQLPAVQNLVAALGPQGRNLLAAAYFQGDVVTLTRSLNIKKGAGTWDQWVTLMKAQKFPEAAALLA